MIAIGCYFVFAIYLAGLTLSVEGKIKETDVKKFLCDIFELHNDYRQKHMVGKLNRTPAMDRVASQILDNIFMEEENEYYDRYGKNFYEKKYNEDTKLNTSEAESIFLEWYKTAISYNYFFELANNESHNTFTRIVWKDTEMFGIAMRMTNNNYVVQVVYFPPGNMLGEYQTNVFQRPIIAHINCSELNQFIYNNDKTIFEDYIFYLHNVARIKHGVPLLKRDEELDAFAVDVLNAISNDMHKPHEMYGKNYLEKEYDDNTVLDNVEAKGVFLKWYNKLANYNHRAKPINKEAAKTTQIVWEGTQTMGISMLREEGFYRVLVLYNPPRDIDEEFQSNVYMPRTTEQGESSSYIDN